MTNEEIMESISSLKHICRDIEWFDKKGFSEIRPFISSTVEMLELFHSEFCKLPILLQECDAYKKEIERTRRAFDKVSEELRDERIKSFKQEELIQILRSNNKLDADFVRFTEEGREINLQEFQKNVLQWSKDRGIIPNATAEAQVLKSVSEMGELADAVLKRNREDTVDAIGDALVCLVNVAALSGTSLDECAQAAWEQIKDRKGYLNENGAFIKEEQK